jgi:hypothetical protein
LPNQNAKLNHQTELPNQIAELSNWIRFAKLKLNSFCQTELPN